MSDPKQASTTISNITVAMFTIADQDAAVAYYTQTLGSAVTHRTDMQAASDPALTDFECVVEAVGMPRSLAASYTTRETTCSGATPSRTSGLPWA